MSENPVTPDVSQNNGVVSNAQESIPEVGDFVGDLVGESGIILTTITRLLASCCNMFLFAPLNSALFLEPTTLL